MDSNHAKGNWDFEVAKMRKYKPLNKCFLKS